MIRRHALVVLSLTIGLSYPMHAQQLPLTTPDSLAVQFVDLLAAQKFAEAAAVMTERMREALPTEKLSEMWGTLQIQVGTFQERDQVRSSRSGEFVVVLIRATFAKSPLDVKVSIDAFGKVAGLYFVPPPPATAGAPIPGENEQIVQVGAAGWPLPGTLTMPPGTGRLPLVILVHGSGPHDRDETIGPNAPFRDLAQGLAQRGIAVLRYDKRTMVYAERMATEGSAQLTVEAEVVADVLAAVDSARHWPRIDPARIYLVGHSLGGYLLPRILARDRRLAGGVILAGSSRHLEDILLEQIDYLASQQGGGDKGDAAQREMLRNQAIKIKGLTEADRNAGIFLIGAPPVYWLDLRSYDPIRIAESLPMPLLILQGNRDYQVTTADFARWQTLSSRPTVSLKQYPALNHLFIAGTGPSTPAEYQEAGHVDPQVVTDIAAWLTRREAPHP